MAYWNFDMTEAPKTGTTIILGVKKVDGSITPYSPCYWGGEEISETGAFWIWWIPGPEWMREIKDPWCWMLPPESGG